MDNASILRESAAVVRAAAQSHKSAREFHRKKNKECMVVLARIEAEAKAQGIELTEKSEGD